MTFKARFAGVDYRSFATDHRVKVEANIRCAEHFDFNVVDVVSDPYCETEGFGGEIEYAPADVPRCPDPPLADSKRLSQLLKPDPTKSTRMANTVDTVSAYKEAVFQKNSMF
jgi:uroporphyrinogen decarboxylase